MVDSSLENDLLHVVGHTASAKTGVKSSRRRAPSDDSSSDDDDDYKSEEDDVDDEDEDDRGRGGKRVSKMPLKKRDMDKDEDEDDDDDNDDDGYGSDLSFGSDLYKDEDDRERLAAMNELEREEILYERAERRDNFLQRKQRQRDLRAKQQAGRGGDRSGGLLARRGTAASKGGPRSRQDDALGQLKAKQEAKAAKQQRQQDLDNMARKRRDKEAASRGKRDSPRRRDSSSSPAESDYEVSQSEEEEDRRERYEEDEEDRDLRKPDPEAGIEDLQSILLRRSKLAKWCWEPFFEDVVVGCLVRLGIGVNQAGQPVYRICEVAAVDAKDLRKQYKFEGRMTHKYLDCRWGEHRARWEMARMSDKEPMRHEFEEWLRELDREGSRRITVAEVKEKREQLRKANSYVYSAADVKKMLEEKRLADSRPRNAAVEKDRLAKELTIAEERGDMAEVERLVNEIASLDAWAQTHNTVKDQRVLQLARMNKRNKAENFRIASEALSRQNAKEGEADYDPFSRRWTRSQNYYKTPSKVETLSKPSEEELDVEKAVKEALLEKAKQEGQAPDVVARLANEVAMVGNELRDTQAPVDGFSGLMAKHMFDLPLSLEPLQRWGPPHEAYMTRKRIQEATCGPPVGMVVGRKMGTTLTVNDYKRRRGLL